MPTGGGAASNPSGEGVRESERERDAVVVVRGWGGNTPAPARVNQRRSRATGVRCVRCVLSHEQQHLSRVKKGVCVCGGATIHTGTLPPPLLLFRNLK